MLAFIPSVRRSPQQGGVNALVKWVEAHKKRCRSMWLKCQAVFFTVSMLRVHHFQGHAAESFQPTVSCWTYRWSGMTLCLCSLLFYLYFFWSPLSFNLQPMADTELWFYLPISVFDIVNSDASLQCVWLLIHRQERNFSHNISLVQIPGPCENVEKPHAHDCLGHLGVTYQLLMLFSHPG